MNEFNMPADNQNYIAVAMLENPTNRPIHIISDEYSSLNKRILHPRERLQINLEVPAGFREFIKPDVICGRQVVFVGRILAEAAEPFIYTIDD